MLLILKYFIEIKTGMNALNKSNIIHNNPEIIPQCLITLPASGFLSSEISVISTPYNNFGII